MHCSRHSFAFTALGPALFAIFAICTWSLHARAAGGSMHLRSSSGADVIINAAKLYADSTKQTIDLSGDVHIVYDQQFISCDHAFIDKKTETVQADGNLVISSPQAYLEGDSAVLSYATNTGTIINGFVKSGPVVFEGRVVKKTGPQSFDADDASFTACTTCPTAWTFAGSRIQAELGGYAYIKHAKLKVANIPALWLPYLIVPLKSERQTGVLIPSIDYNANGGTGLGESFFWAINRSQDATFGLKYYTLRGFKELLNYRYVLTPTSDGELNMGYIHDRVFSAAPELNGATAGAKTDRLFTTYHHNFDLPDGFNTKLNINYVSDLLYPKDFPEEVLGRGDPALDNRFALTRNTERTHASVDASYYINQLHSNVIDTNRESVHRIPELRFDLIDRPVASEGLLSGLLFNFHSDYANFVRDDQAWDDVQVGLNGATLKKDIDRTRSLSGSTTVTGPDGKPLTYTFAGSVFDPATDVVRTGQRIDLLPEISAPFRLGHDIDVLPVIGIRHTQYSLNVTPPEGSTFDPSPYRQYIRGTISFRTTFSKIYGDASSTASEPPRPSVTNWSDNESRTANEKIITPPAPVRPDVYRHEFQPEIVLDGVKDTHDATNSSFLGVTQRNPSFLDSQPISNSDFEDPDRGIQFDYDDRLTNRNTIATYLTNRLVKKSWQPDGTALYKQVATLKLGESYDFDEESITNRQKFLFSDTSMLLDMRLDHFETNTLVQYFPYHGKTNTSSRVRVMDDHGRYAEINYVENYLITLNRDDALANHTQTLGFVLGFSEKFLNFLGTINLTPTDWNNAHFDVSSWGAVMNIKPPGNCWGIILTLRQDLGQKLDYHVNFDYSFGGQGPRVAAAQ